MRVLYLILLCALCGVNLYAQHIEDKPRLLDSLLNSHKGMHFYQSPTLGKTDSVWHRTERFYLYFDIDSICRQYIRNGEYFPVPDALDYLFYSVFTEMTPEKSAAAMEKMQEIAKTYQSEALMFEVELAMTGALASDSLKIAHFRAIADEALRRKDTDRLIRAKEAIFSYAPLFADKLNEAFGIIDLMDGFDPDHVHGHHNTYFLIGESFYNYGYYEQVVPLLKKALIPPRYFHERANLSARNTLGLYYRNVEDDLDLSDYYFRSILESPDMVKFRIEYDAIAICNLARNYMLRKDYPKAEMLLQKGLPVMVNQRDYTFSTGICINLGECYMAMGKLPQAKRRLTLPETTSKTIRYTAKK